MDQLEIALFKEKLRVITKQMSLLKKDSKEYSKLQEKANMIYKRIIEYEQLHHNILK